MSRKILSLTLSISLLFQYSGFAQSINLADYLSQGHNVVALDRFRPLALRYFSYEPSADSFKILLDKGDQKNLSDIKIKDEADKLLTYFKIGLTLPNEKFWVNLRPDAADQIIDPELEKTDLGKVLLEADLQLKKDTSSLTSPQSKEGKIYWDKLYKKAGELFGTENITIPTITRPWIVPGEIIVRESKDSAYIYKAVLKVMLEEDYLTSRGGSRTAPTYQQYAFSDPRLKELNKYSTELIRETILPELTKRINSSRDYASLRQVFFSLILARWFKDAFGSSGSSRAPEHQSPENSYIRLIDSGDLNNLTSKEAWSKTAYFNEYKKSFKDGEYNLSEKVHTPTGQSIRRYTSGGMLDLMTGERHSYNPGTANSSIAEHRNMVEIDRAGNLKVGSPLVEDRELAKWLSGGLNNEGVNLFGLIEKAFEGKGSELIKFRADINIAGVVCETLEVSRYQQTIKGDGVKYRTIEFFADESSSEYVLQIKVYNDGRIETLSSKKLNDEERLIIAAVIRKIFKAESLIIMENLLQKAGVNYNLVEQAIQNRQRTKDVGIIPVHNDRGVYFDPDSRIKIGETQLNAVAFNKLPDRLTINIYDRHNNIEYGHWIGGRIYPGEKISVILSNTLTRILPAMENANEIQIDVVDMVLRALEPKYSEDYFRFRARFLDALNATKSSSAVEEYKDDLKKILSELRAKGGLIPEYEYNGINDILNNPTTKQYMLLLTLNYLKGIWDDMLPYFDKDTFVPRLNEIITKIHNSEDAKNMFSSTERIKQAKQAIEEIFKRNEAILGEQYAQDMQTWLNKGEAEFLLSVATDLRQTLNNSYVEIPEDRIILTLIINDLKKLIYGEKAEKTSGKNIKGGAIAGSPLMVEDLNELRGIHIPVMTKIPTDLNAKVENLLRSVNAVRKLIYGNSAEEISLDKFTDTGRGIYNYCTQLLSELKVVIFSSEYISTHGIDAEMLETYMLGVDGKSKKTQEFLAGIKDLVAAYKAYKLGSDNKRSGSPLTVKEFSQKLDNIHEKGEAPREAFLRLIKMASQLSAREEISEKIQDKIYAIINHISNEEAEYILREKKNSARQARTIGSVLTIIKSGLSNYIISEEIKIKLIQAIKEALIKHPKYSQDKEKINAVITTIKKAHIEAGKIKWFTRFIEDIIKNQYPAMQNVIDFNKGEIAQLFAQLLEKDERAGMFIASVRMAKERIDAQHKYGIFPSRMQIDPVTKASLLESMRVERDRKRIRFDELEKILAQLIDGIPAQLIDGMQEYFASNYIKTFFNGLKKAEAYYAKEDILFSALNISGWKDVQVSEDMESKWKELDNFLAQGFREYYLNAAIEVRDNFFSEDKDEEKRAEKDAKQVINFLEGYEVPEKLFDVQLHDILRAWYTIKESSSSLTVSERNLPEGLPSPKKVLGGIDFRQMNMLIQPQGSFASSSLDFSLPALSRAEIEAFDLDKELELIQRMASSGIDPIVGNNQKDTKSNNGGSIE